MAALSLLVRHFEQRRELHAAADAKKTDAPTADGAPPPAEKSLTTRSTRNILLICVVAGAIDSLGDEGNRFARSTISIQRESSHTRLRAHTMERSVLCLSRPCGSL